MTEDLVFLRHLRALRRHAWLIGLCLASAVGAAALFLATQDSVYRASMKILVGQGGGQFRPTNPGAVDPFTQTMADLLKSDIVATNVIRDLHLELTPRELLGHLAVSTKPQTAVLAVRYDTTDRVAAVTILRQTGDVFSRLVTKRLQAQTGSQATARVSATIFDPAHLEQGRVSPHSGLTFGLAAAFALLIGIGLALTREALKPRVDSRDQAEEWLDAPVVGTLPKRSARTSPLGVWSRASGSASVVRALAPLTSQLRAKRAAADRTIVVTSAGDNDGRGVLAAHLGAALAAAGEKVVCIEMDGIGPTVSSYLDVGANADGPAPYGLIDSDGQVVTGPPPDAPILWVLPARQAHSSGTDAVSSDALIRLTSTLSSTDRYVIVDAPPLLLSTQTLALALASGTIVVAVRKGSTTKDEAEAVRRLLATAEQKRIGVVLCHPSAPRWRRSRPARRPLPARDARPIEPRGEEDVLGRPREAAPRVEAPPRGGRSQRPRKDPNEAMPVDQREAAPRAEAPPRGRRSQRPRKDPNEAMPVDQREAAPRVEAPPRGRRSEGPRKDRAG